MYNDLRMVQIAKLHQDGLVREADEWRLLNGDRQATGRNRVLAALGRLLVAAGTALQDRYGVWEDQMVSTTKNPVERAL
jgi:hypothetical protein